MKKSNQDQHLTCSKRSKASLNKAIYWISRLHSIPLLHFEGNRVNQPRTGILFAYRDYLELAEWTGRIVRTDERSYMDNELPPILRLLQIAPDQWHLNATRFEAIHASRFNRRTPSIDTD